MSVLKHRRGVEAVPTARGVANVMMADLTEALLSEMGRPVAARPRPPLPLGTPARSTAVLLDLRAADSGLGMRRPSAPGPRLSQWTLTLRSLAGLVAVVAVYDHVADEIDAALAELVALAPLTVKGVA